MSWEHIRAQRDTLAEDPIKEVAAMQYLSRWSQKEHERQNTMQIMQQLSMGDVDMNTPLAGMNMSSPSSRLNAPFCTGNNSIGNNPWIEPQPQAQAMESPTLSQSTLESHIMMPLDLLSDDRNLYSVMPYCSGGELFDVLEKKNRFSEAEARYWMRQILKVRSMNVLYEWHSNPGGIGLNPVYVLARQKTRPPRVCHASKRPGSVTVI